MIIKILFAFTILFNLNTVSQISKNIPCAPGMNGYMIYSLDLDNDGITSFDIDYYIQYHLRPKIEETFQVSSSGYKMIFYNSNNVKSDSPYTNLVNNELCNIEYEYSGSGPVFNTNPVPPNYCPIYLSTDVTLVAVKHNLDNDSDGILNINEDTNNNLNLMDDDDDNDGIINLLDPLSLSNIKYNNESFKIYPNPTTNDVINITSDLDFEEVTIYDYTGKIVYNTKEKTNSINLEKFSKGTYVLKIREKDNFFIAKIVLN